MLIQLVTGALLLTGIFVPAALCVVMPTSACALYWALLEHQPFPLLLALVALMSTSAAINQASDSLERVGRKFTDAQKLPVAGAGLMLAGLSDR